MEGMADFVAFVESSSVVAVIHPTAIAYPAPLELTRPAGDVVTSLILLYPHCTLRTALGVGDDPVGVVGLEAALLLPRHQLRAAAGLVRLLLAFPAEGVAEGACDGLNAAVERVEGVGTGGGSAPAHRHVVFHI